MKKEETVRIAQIIGKWVGGGVEAVVMNYYRHIDRTKIQFDFICDEDSTNIPYKEIESLGGKVILIPPYQKPFSYHFKLKKVLKEGNYKIVHSHINTMSLFSLFAAWCARVPVRIAHSHSTSNPKEIIKNGMKLILRPFCRLFATDYMCCSEFAGRWLFGNKTYESGKVYLMNNAIELDKFKYNAKIRTKKRKELKIKDDTLVIGHIGRFVEQKNHSFLIDIFNELHKKNPNSILLLVGQGPLVEKMKDKVNKLGLTNCVNFLGQRNEANELYQAFDVFVLPSLYEGLGMVLIEAQCAGCYCVASYEVPEVAKISDNFEFLDLNQSLDDWSKVIISSDYQTRTKILNFSCYDISEESLKLQKKYMSFIDNGHNKISFFCQRWTSGGIERMVTMLISKGGKNYEYEIVTSQKENDVFDEELKMKNVEVRTLNNRVMANPLLRNLYSLRKYGKYLKYNKPGTAYINVYNSMGAIYGYIAKHCGVKNIIIHAHNNGFDNDKLKIKSMINSFFRIVFRNKKFVYIACSKEAALFCFNKNIVEKCEIINNGIDVSNFKYNEVIRKKYRKMLKLEDKFVIGNVARMTEQKNQLRLLDIFCEIKKSNENSVLLIVGDGPLESKIKEKINEYRLNDSVILLKKREDVNCLMQAMDIFIFPSIYEGFGVVAIEAQASGLPTFISDSLSKQIFASSLAIKLDLKLSDNLLSRFILGNSKVFSKRESAELRDCDIDNMVKKIQSKF